MSHYAKYMKEAFNREVIEDESGFICFHQVPNAPHVCCLLDIYIVPEFRGKRESSSLESQAIAWAKERGCTKVVGSLNTEITTPERSMSIFLKYGYKLSHVDGKFMFFIKDIQGDL